ncbi:hypothetical protein GCM10010994_22640 [Chelatococcus reniformis]|uniref:DUF2092 domain-containing protein n=1 Tax=Chelatococcus reniformis TaxID=1494448 RepID=A0A916XDZ1_9HYPH|nr:hypothetical protein GCM10010994_22640 [Chelatococcus reniformis]
MAQTAATPAPAQPAAPPQATPAGQAPATGQTAAPAEAPKPVIEQKALDLVKAMSDKLAAAKTLSVSARGMREVLSTQNNMLIFFSTTRVELQRPDRLNAVVDTDGQRMRFVYDGRTLTVADTSANLFSKLDAPGSLDETLQVAGKQGIHLALADFLYSNPYKALTDGLTTAYEVQTTQLHNAKVKHLAFAGKGVEWQIWIDTETQLPHLLAVTYTDTERHPHFLVELRNWELNKELPAKAFEFTPPANAAQIEFLPAR